MFDSNSRRNVGAPANPLRCGAALALAVSFMACAPPQPRSAPQGLRPDPGVSPLGPSYVLLPLPGEEDSLLGRVIADPLAPGQALEETSRPNPCLDHLTQPHKSPAAVSFESADELRTGARAKAVLESFGFGVEASEATHFFYRLDTDARVSRSDTNEYVECCKEKDCGYGFVSALVHGEGVYGAARELSGSGHVDVVAASVGAEIQLRLLQRRKVRGFVAAVLRVTDRKKAEAAGQTDSLGLEPSLPESVKTVYEANRIHVEARSSSFVFVDGRGNSLSENEFVRRYRTVTGSDELDDLDRHRSLLGVSIAIPLAVGGAVVGVFGVLNWNRTCGDAWYNNADFIAWDPTSAFMSKCAVKPGTPGAVTVTWNTTLGGDQSATIDPEARSNIADKNMVILGLTGLFSAAGFGALALGLGLGARDGALEDHYLTDPQASTYVERYNRALLRRTRREILKGDARRDAPLRVLVGAGSLGVEGRF